MFGIGIQELLIILVIVLIVFGANKLPEVGGGLGRAIRNFKRAISEPDEVDITPDKKKKPPTIRTSPECSVRLCNDLSANPCNERRVEGTADFISSMPQHGKVMLEKARTLAMYKGGMTMKVEQLSIFLENKTGRLADVTRTLAEAKINLRALSLADTSDFGILRLIVDDTEQAKTILKDAGFTVGRTIVVAVQVEDTPGGLDHILQTLTTHHINVEYMYAFVQKRGDKATMIFRFDRTDQAIEVLLANHISVLTQTTLNG